MPTKRAPTETKVSKEVFVWGSDKFGQLGLGHKYLHSGKYDDEKVLKGPKSCSFAIQISDIACGEDFAFLLTGKGLLYAMGSNQFGKLGILTSQKPNHCDMIDDKENYNSNQLGEVPYVNTPKLVDYLSK